MSCRQGILGQDVHVPQARPPPDLKQNDGFAPPPWGEEWPSKSASILLDRPPSSLALQHLDHFFDLMSFPVWVRTSVAVKLSRLVASTCGGMSPQRLSAPWAVTPPLAKRVAACRPATPGLRRPRFLRPAVKNPAGVPDVLQELLRGNAGVIQDNALTLEPIAA